MSTSLAINYFPHSQKQGFSIAKNGLSVGKPEFWEDLKKKKKSKQNKAQLFSLKKLS